MPSFTLPALPVAGRLEVLQVDAAPIVCHFLSRLDLPGLFDRHLADLPGRRPDVPSATILGVLAAIPGESRAAYERWFRRGGFRKQKGTAQQLRLVVKEWS